MNPSTGQAIVDLLKSVSHSQKEPIPLHAPTFNGNEIKYVNDCIKSTWVSSVGSYVNSFEQKIGEFCNMPYVVATVNGTCALQTAYHLVGVKANTEVLMPTLSFVATANAATYLQAIPHFYDSEPEHLGVELKKLKNHLKKIASQQNGNVINKKTGRPITALVVMHTFGHPCQLSDLRNLADEYGLPLIEDAAEALGSFYDDKHVGHWGDITCLSFNGNKVITTGGGGAILTPHKNLAERAKHLTTTAKVPHQWEYKHDEVGYNFRLPNINAALGCAQLEYLPRLLEKKQKLAQHYARCFEEITDVRFVSPSSRTNSNYWLNSIILKSESREDRDHLLKITNASGFQTRPCWNLLHSLPMYKASPRSDLAQAETIENSLINIPSSPTLWRD